MMTRVQGYHRHYAQRQFLSNALTKRYNASLIGNIPVETYSTELEYNHQEVEEKKEKLTSRQLLKTQHHKILYQKEEIDDLN